MIPAWARRALPWLLLVPGLFGAVGLMGAVSGWADAAAQLTPVTVWLAIGAVVLAVRFAAPIRLKGLVVVGLAANLVLAGPDEVAGMTARHAEPGPADLVVMTFNVWDSSADHRPAIAAIRASGADVVTLQEGLGLLRSDMKGLRDLYPYRASCQQWWGCEIVILSKRPLRNTGWRGAPDGPRPHPWTVWAVTTAPDGRPVRVVSTHLPWPLPPAARAAQAKALVRTVRDLGPEDIVLTGDLNGTGAAWSLRRLDQALAPMSRRTLGLATWPDRIPGVDLPSRLPLLGIDHLYASHAFRTVAMRRGPATGSDHRAVVVRLSRREER